MYHLTVICHALAPAQAGWLKCGSVEAGRATRHSIMHIVTGVSTIRACLVDVSTLFNSWLVYNGVQIELLTRTKRTIEYHLQSLCESSRLDTIVLLRNRPNEPSVEALIHRHVFYGKVPVLMFHCRF